HRQREEEGSDPGRGARPERRQRPEQRLEEARGELGGRIGGLRLGPAESRPPHVVGEEDEPRDDPEHHGVIDGEPEQGGGADLAPSLLARGAPRHSFDAGVRGFGVHGASPPALCPPPPYPPAIITISPPVAHFTCARQAWGRPYARVSRSRHRRTIARSGGR